MIDHKKMINYTKAHTSNCCGW